MSRDSLKNTFLVAGILCVVCSLLVSSTYVGLKDRQEENKQRDKKLNILEACGLDKETTDVDHVYANNVMAKLVDLDTGQYIDQWQDGSGVEQYDLTQLFEDESRYMELSRQQDLPGIEKRENIAAVYIYTEGDTQRIVLPVRGKGLWSTLWGFVAVDSTGSVINGITFYEHGETPGLGGEVDNINWKELWKSGKQIYSEDGSVKVKVLKKGTPQTDVNSQVDGLAGATITTNGVSKLLEFWLGDLGFKKFLTLKPWLAGSDQPQSQSVAAQDIDNKQDGEK
ncbi:MAG: Na(+)-translocating NADH-quinone reductase subunit C [Pirellulaceae bacterium]